MDTSVLQPLINYVDKSNGNIYVVGGAVRDEILGLESKDLDILITKIPFPDLVKALSALGKVDEVGKSFGIIKFTPDGSDEIIDVALPRVERSIGAGHKDFEVNFDHTLSVEADLGRRDFTINAIAKNLVSGHYIDPFGGLQHLKDGVIHPVYEDSFKDDPLRILRAVQFSARFGFKISWQAKIKIMAAADGIKELSQERVSIELAKLFGKGKSEALNSALNIVWRDVFPELTPRYDHSKSIPFHVVPKDMELRFLILMCWSKFEGSRVQPNSKQLASICERLKLSSGGFNVIRMLHLYDQATADFPNVLANQVSSSDYMLRKFVSSNLKGNWKSFWDVCTIWTCSDNAPFPTTMLKLGEIAFRVKDDPIRLKDLVVNGEDAKILGLEGKHIGEALNKCLDMILKDPTLNQRNILIDVFKQMAGNSL